MNQVKMGRLIAELRKQKGLTQQQLADQICLSNKTISKWESGVGCPDIGNLPVLAEALGVSVDELLKGELRAQPEADQTAQRRKWERAVIALAASIGALLGILAYQHGWLG